MGEIEGRLEFNSHITEKLAEAVHRVFCEDLRARGYTYGAATDGDKKRHSSLLPYAELPEDEKEQNRGNARDIQNKLARAGYKIVQARGHQPPARFTAAEVERLAENEHERWMKQKLADGWKHAQKTSKAKKLHKDLVPWIELPDEEKAKDRTLVRGIPEILSRAGYIMVKSK